MTKCRLKIDAIAEGDIEIKAIDSRSRVLLVGKITVDLFIRGLKLIEPKDEYEENKIKYSLMTLEQFKKERLKRIESNPKNEGLKQASDAFVRESVLSKYSYNFSWLGRPIIQYPQDI